MRAVGISAFRGPKVDDFSVRFVGETLSQHLPVCLPAAPIVVGGWLDWVVWVLPGGLLVLVVPVRPGLEVGGEFGRDTQTSGCCASVYPSWRPAADRRQREQRPDRESAIVAVNV
jgi:hypothetical protein